MVEQSENPVLDVDAQSVRGRACPVCGGKIIPSITAVFQGSPAEVYVSWQCERCGYMEVFERPEAPGAAKHAKPAAKALMPAGQIAAENGVAETGVASNAGLTKSSQGDLPPDVKRMLQVMKNPRKPLY